MEPDERDVSSTDRPRPDRPTSEGAGPRPAESAGASPFGAARPAPPQPGRLGLIDRLKHGLGRFFGSGGRRAGYRDPDPGNG